MLNMKSKIFKYIYAMLCLLPAIAVGVTCVYVANNDNAYESYSGNVTQNEYVDVDNLPLYDVRTTIGRNTSISDTTTTLYVDNLSILRTNVTNQTSLDNLLTSSFFRFWHSSTYNGNYFTWENAGTNYNANDYFIEVQFDVISFDGDLNGYDVIYRVVDLNGLDNVFYYSLDKVENSSVFSWVKSNFLYDGMNSFVGTFGGTNSNISFYLTWVLTISLCYLGFEVLMLFINMARNLIHSFTDKDRW